MVNHTARYTISLFSLGQGKALSAAFCLVIILAAFPGPIPAVLTDEGRIERGWLGVEISDITPQIQQDLDLKNRAGAFVRHVVKGGPAEKAGLLQGDVITQVNSYSVYDTLGLANKINEIAPGKTVALRFIRNGSTYKTQAILGKRPSRSASGKASRAETDYQENEKFLELLGKKPSGKEPPAVDESEFADRRAVHEALERELFENSELGNKGTSRENKPTSHLNGDKHLSPSKTTSANNNSSTSKDTTGRVVRVSAQNITIRLDKQNCSPQPGDKVRLFYVTSSGMEMKVGVWQVTKTGTREIQAKVFNSITKPRVDMKAIITCEDP